MKYIFFKNPLFVEETHIRVCIQEMLQFQSQYSFGSFAVIWDEKF